MKKIMFICTGNTCRSAMAQAIMQKKSDDEKLNFEIYSSGLYAETGELATYNAVEAMKDYDIDLSNHKATNIRESAIKDMNLILCATTGHKNMLMQMYPELSEKMYTIKEYAGYDDKDIRDPWGYDLETYKKCAKEIYDCIIKIIDKEKE